MSDRPSAATLFVVRRVWLFFLALAACEIPEFRYPPAAPRVERLDVQPIVAEPGDPVVLSYRVTGASSAVLLGLADSPRTVDPSEGSVTLIADETRTIVLEVSGEGGTTRAATGFSLDPVAPVRILDFRAEPTVISPGGVVRVFWSVRNARQVTVTVTTDSTKGLYEGDQSDGLVVYRPERVSDLAFEIRADGDLGPVRANVSVQITPRLPLIFDFHASPVTVLAPETHWLHWRVGAADEIRIFEESALGDILLQPPEITTPVGSIELVADVGPHLYRIEAVSGLGIVSERTSAVVLPPAAAEIIGFTATPTVVGFGGETRLEWRTRNATQVTIVGVAGGLPGTGSYAAEVRGDRSFRLEAFNYVTAVQSAMVDVRVSPALPALSAELIPRRAAIGDQVILEAVTDPPALLSVEIDGVPVITATSAAIFLPFIAERSQYYRVIAEGPGGRTERTFSLLVQPRPEIDLFTVDQTQVRAGRHLRFEWQTRNASTVWLDLGNRTPLTPASGGVGFFAPSQGAAQAWLLAQNLVSTTQAMLPLEVLGIAQQGFDEEPNDTTATAQGPYPFDGVTISGELTPGDVDQIAWSFNQVYRPYGTTEPGPGLGCQGTFEVSVLEDRPEGPIDHGIVLGPGCPVIDATIDEALADLQPPLLFVLRQSPFSGSTVPYFLSLSVRSRACGDGVLDLFEDCDDGNPFDGDGCNQVCFLEDADPETGFGIPTMITADQQVSGYLGAGDYDTFAFSISPFDVGPRVLTVEPVLDFDNPNGVDLDVTLIDLTNGYGYEGTQGPTGGVTFAPAETVLEAGDFQIIIHGGPGRTLPRRGRYLLTIAPGG